MCLGLPDTGLRDISEELPILTVNKANTVATPNINAREAQKQLANRVITKDLKERLAVKSDMIRQTTLSKKKS